MRILVDLLWVRHGISGGTESVIRNLMYGFGKYAEEHEFIYLVAKDNASTFDDYKGYHNFDFVTCNTESASRWRRTLWQRTHINKIAKRVKAEVYFSPIYSILGKLCVPTVAVIHDLQALHFPEYFSAFRNKYMYWSWKETCKKADRVVTISEFCREDIIKNIGIDPSRISVVYDPVISSFKTIPFSNIGKRLGIEELEYFYTVSSLAKHKNLITLIKAFEKINDSGKNERLVITGIKVNAANEINQYIKDHNLQDQIIFTGFISNEERDALYKECKAFLYPSTFEGFGMPPIEAMRFGVPTIVSDATCLREVTQDKAIYIDNPLDVDQWCYNIMNLNEARIVNEFRCYDLPVITKGYIENFKSAIER